MRGLNCKNFLFALAAGVLLILSAQPCAVAAEIDKGSSAQMMDRIETLLYGSVSTGGLIDRLSSAEGALFGRSLPGTIAERHAAILNFLEVGQEDQPSVLFKLGVAEWIVNKRIEATKPVKVRIETLEGDLTGDTQHGQPLVMRLENVLATLVTDPVTASTVTLPANTVIRLRFLDELSPAKSKVGDKVRIELADDLAVNSYLVAPTGSLLLTEVRQVKRPGMFGMPGEVRLNFNGLVPLGPQRPEVMIGEESKKAIEEAKKMGDRGEGVIVGAGAASIAGAVILGPVGLISGAFIRGNSIRIPEGAITYVQIAKDIAVSAYLVPESLRPASMTPPPPNDSLRQQDSAYDPEKDMIIKRDADVFNRRTPQGAEGTLNLPPEQQVN